MVSPNLGVILFKQGTQAEFRRFTAVAQKSRTVKFLPRRTSWPVSQTIQICTRRYQRPWVARSRAWLKFKNLAAPAVKREAEEDWGR
jgi:hypothetical protein